MDRDTSQRTPFAERLVADLLRDEPPASRPNVVEKYVSLGHMVLNYGRLETVGSIMEADHHLTAASQFDTARAI